MEWRTNKCGHDAIYFRDVEVGRILAVNYPQGTDLKGKPKYVIEFVLPSYTTKPRKLTHPNLKAAKRELVYMVGEWLEATGLSEKDSVADSESFIDSILP
jgi:hypothetical protein